MLCVFGLAALIAVSLTPNVYASRGGEVIAFQVTCLFPEYPYERDPSLNCAGGLSDLGLGTPFNGIASPPALLENFSYGDPLSYWPPPTEPNQCVLAVGRGILRIGPIYGWVDFSFRGPVGVVTYDPVSGAGFSNAAGVGLAIVSSNNPAKLSSACLGATQANLELTITGVVFIADPT